MPRFQIGKRSGETDTTKRVFVVGAVFAVAFGLLGVRAVFFHIKDNAALEKVAMRQYRTAVHQSTKRGKILDANGRELAIDVTVESVYANPREIDEPVFISTKLSKILGIDRAKFLERLSTGRKFVWVKRRVAEKDAKSVMDLGIKGIYSMRESSRSYPGKHLASSILGAVGFDSSPLGGVELYYNELLAAETNKPDVKRDARGHLYLSPTTDSENAKFADVYLTIDRTLQYLAEKELSKAVEKAHSKGGTAVVVDVNSGAILAMANMPTFDPNDYEKYGLSSWKNRAVSDAYEPGSTFKSIIVAAALDQGFVKPEDVFDCENGGIKIGPKVVKDSHPHGKLSVADIIKVSSNIGAFKIEKKLGERRAYDSIRAFGFGKTSGIDLPGESAGILSQPERWSELQFATIAFGQGIAATPLQMSMAFAAIANGGALYKPYVVKKILGEEGREIYSAAPVKVGQPIGEKGSKLITELLKRVTGKGGTGTQAASLEYETAGKTGTAQKADPRTGGYAKGKYYSSFVGFAPANEPKIVVYVGIDEPSGGAYYGGQIAAPVFREIVEGTLHYLKVPGKTIVASKGDEVKSDDETLKDETAELAIVIAEENERHVVAQDGSQSWKLPDLRGLTMRGVLEAASGAEITWKFNGSGVALRQRPDAGAVIAAGGECEVEFGPLM